MQKSQPPTVLQSSQSDRLNTISKRRPLPQSPQNALPKPESTSEITEQQNHQSQLAEASVTPKKYNEISKSKQNFDQKVEENGGHRNQEIRPLVRAKRRALPNEVLNTVDSTNQISVQAVNPTTFIGQTQKDEDNQKGKFKLNGSLTELQICNQGSSFNNQKDSQNPAQKQTQPLIFQFPKFEPVVPSNKPQEETKVEQTGKQTPAFQKITKQDKELKEQEEKKVESNQTEPLVERIGKALVTKIGLGNNGKGAAPASSKFFSAPTNWSFGKTDDSKTKLPADATISSFKPKKVEEPKLIFQNPLCSAAALKQKEELTLSTKEKEKRANESPIKSSLFDYKGNSKFKNSDSPNNNDNNSKIDTKTQAGQPNVGAFKNPFAQASTNFVNPFAKDVQPIDNNSNSQTDNSKSKSTTTIKSRQQLNTTNIDMGSNVPKTTKDEPKNAFVNPFKNPFASFSAPNSTNEQVVQAKPLENFSFGPKFGNPLNTTFNPFQQALVQFGSQPPKDNSHQNSKEDIDEEESHDKLIEEEQKETLTSTTQQSKSKLFQAQIDKLAVLKGLGQTGKCVKENGYLSIEKQNAMSCVVMRTFAGMSLFVGFYNKLGAKIKVLDNSNSGQNLKDSVAKSQDEEFVGVGPCKYGLKCTVAVQAVASKENQHPKSPCSLALEHIEIAFLSASDRDNFIAVYKSLANVESNQ